MFQELKRYRVSCSSCEAETIIETPHDPKLPEGWTYGPIMIGNPPRESAHAFELCPKCSKESKDEH